MNVLPPVTTPQNGFHGSGEKSRGVGSLGQGRRRDPFKVTELVYENAGYKPRSVRLRRQDDQGHF